jgi:Pyruvate/2-oxoglutarate dehydrogenase complex, dihydrolipoamide dehydrogenase (E3) component, and related enzymes
MSEEFDYLVIGAGPGGYVSAIRAAQLGLKAAIIEREHFGGICLNWGCIPTKALLRSAEVLEFHHHAANYGVKSSGATADLTAMVKRSRDIAKQLNQGVQHLLKKNKSPILHGCSQTHEQA